MIYRVRTGNKTGTSWRNIAARRAGRGKKGLAVKHHRSARDSHKHPQWRMAGSAETWPQDVCGLIRSILRLVVRSDKLARE